MKFKFSCFFLISWINSFHEINIINEIKSSRKISAFTVYIFITRLSVNISNFSNLFCRYGQLNTVMMDLRLCLCQMISQYRFMRDHLCNVDTFILSYIILCLTAYICQLRLFRNTDRGL